MNDTARGIFHGAQSSIQESTQNRQDELAAFNFDTPGTVRWCRRNLPHKPWSVQAVLDNEHPFFPDFIVGIEGRHIPDGALLTDPTFQFEIATKVPKSHVELRVYGEMRILTQQSGVQRITVRYDAAHQRAIIDREFRLVDSVAC